MAGNMSMHLPPWINSRTLPCLLTWPSEHGVVPPGGPHRLRRKREPHIGIQLEAGADTCQAGVMFQ